MDFGANRLGRYFSLCLLGVTLHCGSLAARCGFWPGDRISGRADAPATSYWKSATVITTHEKGYAGGHGGGTTFHTMKVVLRLWGTPDRSRAIILEKGTLPLTSEADFVYALVSRDYDLRFSEDGTKLAITYDQKDYGYIALDKKSPALLFHRERRFHAKPEADFWTAFPRLEDYAVELLADLQFTKSDAYKNKTKNEDPPYFRTLESSSDDFVTDLTDQFLKDYATNDKIYGAALRGALEVGRHYPVSNDRLAFLREKFPAFASLRPEIHQYLRAGKIGVNAIASAAFVLSSNPDESDLPLLAAALNRFTSEMKKSDPNYRTYHTWDYNRYLWAMAAIAKRLPRGDAALRNEIARVLSLKDAAMAYDVHPAQVYAIQALARMNAEQSLLQKLAASDAAKLPDVWPKEYTDPHRDYCAWEEKYSDCRRFSLAAWARAALER